MIWRYKAIPIDGAPTSRVVRGEQSASTGSEARALLRRAGLRVLEIKPTKNRSARTTPGLASTVRAAVDRHLRERRRLHRSDFFDSLGTMLAAGVTLESALGTLSSGAKSGRASRVLAAELRDSIRSGTTLAEATETCPTWFDSVDTAMIRVGEQQGELTRVLAAIVRRHQRASVIGSRVAAALAYPAVVATVGVGVVVFLSTRVLPDLRGVLAGAGIETPLLTTAVIATGQSLVRFGIPVAFTAIIAVVLLTALLARSERAARVFASMRWPIPVPVRQVGLARLFATTSEMLDVGIPFVEALRGAAHTVRGVLLSPLRACTLAAADQIEQGESIASSLDDDKWFSPEIQRMLMIGESSGELPDILDRLAKRLERRAERTIDAFSRAIEPTVILVLAFFVGLVVMSAILPLIRLQEMI